MRQGTPLAPLRGMRLAPDTLRDHLGRLFPDERVVSIEALPRGYERERRDCEIDRLRRARPCRADRPRRGARREIVFRVATLERVRPRSPRGPRRRMLLAFDDFARIPRHVAAIDVGAIDPTASWCRCATPASSI